MTEPRRVGILANVGWLGGENYIGSVVRALRVLKDAERRSDYEIVLAAGPAERARLGDDVLEAADECIENDVYSAPRSLQANLRVLVDWGRPNVTAARMASFASRHRLDFAFPARYGAKRPRRMVAVEWIPDFGHVTNPESNDADECRRREAAFAAAAEFADRVVLSSGDAAGFFASRYPAHARKANIYRFRASLPDMGGEAPADVQRRYRLPDKFAIICNQFWKHKQHLDAFHALARLEGGIPDLALVCTGPLADYRNPGHQDAVLAAIQTLGLHPRVFLLGKVPRVDQLQLMRRAAFVVQPSSCEGWNTAVEEARALGKRVLLSDLAVHREQAWSECRLFGVGDVAALASGLKELWQTTLPGPDAGEEAARRVAQGLQVEAGREFLAAIGFTSSR